MNNRQRILIYAKSWCGDCRRAKRLLDDFEIPYDEIDVEEQPAYRPVIRQINHGQERVPTILFPDGDILVEPSNNALAAKLGIDLAEWP